MASRTNSEIISLFTQARHENQLTEDKQNLKKFTDVIKRRKDKISALQQKQAVASQEPSKSSISQSIQEAEKFKTMDDHRIPIDEFARRYQTDLEKGLTQAQVDQRLKDDGENKLSEKERMHWALAYLHHMAHFFALLLWGGGILCFIAYGVNTADPSNLYLGIVLIVIVNLSTMVQFVQNRKSEAMMDSFKDFIPSETTVVRDGVTKVINAIGLVKGDLVQIGLGQKIPADVRIIKSNGMKVDNSSLTGETELMSRVAECTNPKNPLETKNIAFFSTLNREGSGMGVVIGTGDRTFIGQIAKLASVAGDDEKTPLQIEINRFVFRLGILAICLGIIQFGVGMAIGFEFITALTLAIGITVANVPNGMLLQVTIALTLTAKRMVAKKILTKNLRSVETLGSTTCICSDKTGTLTMNKMTVAHLWYNGNVVKALNYQKQGANGQYEYDINEPTFKSLQQVAIINSVAVFDRSPPQFSIKKLETQAGNDKVLAERLVQQFIQEWKEKVVNMPIMEIPTIGDASESALIKFFDPIEPIPKTREKKPIIVGKESRELRLLFSSVNKFAFTINSDPRPDKKSLITLHTKGAAQKIWKMCTHILHNGKQVQKTAEWDDKFAKVNSYFGENGQRVLGFAKLHLDKDTYPETYPFNLENFEQPNFPLYKQVFVGLISLNDPPRENVPFSVIKCQAAGVKVIMVTGDQPVTAAAIARQCNIIREPMTVNQIAEKKGINFEEAFPHSDAIVIHGDQITKMILAEQGMPEREQGKQLERWLSKSQIVFARTSPAQKLIIVKACQKMGHIVAVTGDGVNDSPAIKKADIGISMGITGTDVAKDAADMILLNDDFSGIVMGIEQGRKIFDNLKKAICYIMTSQVSEIAPFLGLLILQYPAPITTVILLCIDLGTDFIPAVSFAYEDSEIGIMTRRPRRQDEHLVTIQLMGQGYGWVGWSSFFASLLAFFIVMYDFGFPSLDLFFKNGISIVAANPQDVFNPTSPTFGNTAITGLTCEQFNKKRDLIDWLYPSQASQDLRMTALSCDSSSGTVVYKQLFKFGACLTQQISPISNRPVCFTTQAAKYGQSAYFYANVMNQIVNLYICKTRYESSIRQGMANPIAYFGLTIEIVLTLCLAYIQGLNVVFGTRDVMWIHFGLVGIPFAVGQYFVDEFRKYLIRTLPSDPKTGKPNWFYRNTLW